MTCRQQDQNSDLDCVDIQAVFHKDLKQIYSRQGSYIDFLFYSDPEKREGLEDMYHQQRLSGASLASQRHTPDNLGGANFGGTIKEERPLSLAEVVTHTQAMWKLQTDDNFNATLREDFFFEQVSI